MPKSHIKLKLVSFFPNDESVICIIREFIVLLVIMITSKNGYSFSEKEKANNKQLCIQC